MSERFRTAMSMAQTPEQQEIAREIYRRLEGGAEVEDIKHLIEDELRTVVAQRNRRSVSRPEIPSGVVVGNSGQRRSLPPSSPAKAPTASYWEAHHGR